MDDRHNDQLVAFPSNFINRPFLTSTGAVSSTSANVTLTSCKQRKGMNQFNLMNIVKPMEYNLMRRMSLDAFHRILHADGLFTYFHL